MPLGLKMAGFCALCLFAMGGCLSAAKLPVAATPAIAPPAPPGSLPAPVPSLDPSAAAVPSVNPTPTSALTSGETPTPAANPTAAFRPEEISEPRITGLSGTDLGEGLQLRVFLPQEELDATVRRVVITFPRHGSMEYQVKFNRQNESYYSGVVYVEPSLLEGYDLQWLQQNVGILFGSLSERNPCTGNRRPSNDCSVAMLYSTLPGSAFWDSNHWDDGVARVITSGGDANDPTGWSHFRGAGTYEVNGQGILTMRGSEPRLYLNGPSGEVWKNLEATVYYKRIKDDGKWGGGIVIGARSGPEGHNNQSPCTATTYYGRVRHAGEADFYKELKHPSGEVRARVEVWDDGPLPYHRWIGVKLVVYNTQNAESVRLELYRDLTEGVNGGKWEKLVEYTDTGGWGNAEGCPYASDHIITQGGGAVLLRNTGIDEAHYKWFSVQEIIPPVN